MCERVLTARNGVSLTFGTKLAVTLVSLTSPYVYILSLLCILGLQTLSGATDASNKVVNVTVNEGKNLTLNCTLSGSIFNWSRIEIPNEIEIPHFGSSYALDRVNRSLARPSHKCCNESSICQTFYVVVYYPAEGRINGCRQIQPGGDLSLQCLVDSSPPRFNISWYFEGGLLPTETSASLNQVAVCEREGIYICSPKNILGTALNGTAYVNITAPQPPRNASAMSGSDGKIEVTWKPPGNINQCNVSYQVSYRKKDKEWKNTERTRDLKKILTTDHSGVGQYEIRIKAIVGSKESNFSSTLSVTVEVAGNNSNYLLIILGVVLGVLLVVGLIGLTLLLRSRRRCFSCLSAHCIGFFSVPNDPSPPSPIKRPSIKTKRGPVSVDSFAAHVSYLHTDGDYRFDQEFETLRGIHVRGRSWLHNNKEENQVKNRYANIVAYDQSRVILSLTEEDPESHYINANYVDSYNQINAYIGTQGPMANTIGDFWRMIWEQNCSVIVMITNIIEKGRHKCAMYWPSKQAKSEIHGHLRITHLGEESFAHYTIRRFEVKPSDHSTHYSQLKYPRSRTVTIAMNLDLLEKEVAPMIVTQYHFTGWPDHGAPDEGCEYPALDFILRSAAANQNSSGPIVVHCSAGVGRSGAYIVIHSMVKRMHEAGDLDVFDFLCHIRQQRNHLVQEECQYIFVHDALLHYIESDFKIAILIENLKDHVHKLRRYLTNPSNGKNRLEVECEKLNAIQVKNYNLKQAKRACNAVKNRSMKFIPADSTRVELFPRPREEGSDYINASFLDGFWKAGAYIATQAPLENTANDFWRMIWQENCRSVVMLVSKDELEQGYFPSYLPALYDMARFGKFEVAVDSEIIRGDIVVRELRMVTIQDPSEVRKIRHFHFLHWPEDGTPWSGQTILQLIDKVDSWEKEVRANAKPFELIGAIVVHCNYGAGRTGAYCLLHTMYHQIAREKTVSIYQIARLYNYQRPHCLQNQEQYAFCYDTLVEYIEADCSLHLV